jgi:uncharacterized protein (DUF1697 family)
MGGMATFIVFLRAINLGRTRKVPMADLRDWLADAGCADVETYIQTGNVRLSTTLRSRAKVERTVEDLLADRCGFEVPAMALTPRELTSVYDEAAGLTAPLDGELRQYVTFLKSEPAAEAAAEIDAWDHDGERARVSGRAVHWWLAKPNQQARLSNARLEKVLGPGTTRDVKVVTTLAERWGD